MRCRPMRCRPDEMTPDVGSPRRDDDGRGRTDMSRVRARQIISIDGCAAGPRQSLEHPFGEGGMRLPSGSSRPDRPGREGDAQVIADSVARRRRLRHGPQHVRRRPRRRGTATGAAGGARTRRTTRRCSCSPTTRASRWRWRAGPRSTSSPTASSRRSSRPRAAAGERTCPSPAAPARQAVPGGGAAGRAPPARRAGRARRGRADCFGGVGEPVARAGRGGRVPDRDPHPLPVPGR